VGTQTNVENKSISLLASGASQVENLYIGQQNLGEDVSSWSLRVIAGTVITLFVLMGVAILVNGKSERLKLPLFITMSFIMAGSALALASSTVYLNNSSDSGGPVNRRAGIEFWVCDNEIELINPIGFSNKVGTSILHEQDDQQIHIEGASLNDGANISLGEFMNLIGGKISENELIIPVNPEGMIFENKLDGDGPANPYPDALDNLISVSNGRRLVEATDGQSCNGELSKAQVFVYKFNKRDNTYEQIKLTQPQKYVMSPEATVPPGDCIIVEFSPLKDKTDKLCEQYGARDTERCVEFGVDPKETESCTIRQTNYTPIGTGTDPNLDRGQQ